jgi:predicted RNA binding protein YcfA (HicA-like mRNA interferase family)
MSRWSSCKRKDAIRKLKKLGYEGPSQGGRHQYLEIGSHRLTLFSNEEYSVNQVRLLLREAGGQLGRIIDLEMWSNL